MVNGNGKDTTRKMETTTAINEPHYRQQYKFVTNIQIPKQEINKRKGITKEIIINNNISNHQHDNGKVFPSKMLPNTMSSTRSQREYGINDRTNWRQARFPRNRTVQNGYCSESWRNNYHKGKVKHNKIHTISKLYDKRNKSNKRTTNSRNNTKPPLEQIS